MSSKYPKLSSKFEEILCEFDKILEQKIKSGEIEEIELNISEANFIPRSPRTKAILSLVNSLKNLKIAGDKIDDKEPKTELDEIKKKHVFAAKSLLKLDKYKELATRILVAAMDSSDDDVSEAAIKALGEFGSENLAFKVIDIPFTNVENGNIFLDTAIINGKEVDVEMKYLMGNKAIVKYNDHHYVCSSSNNGAWSNCIKN